MESMKDARQRGASERVVEVYDANDGTPVGLPRVLFALGLGEGAAGVYWEERPADEIGVYRVWLTDEQARELAESSPMEGEELGGAEEVSVTVTGPRLSPDAE